MEIKKAASFRAVKKRIRQRQIFVVILAFAIFGIISFSIAGILKNSEHTISYEDNISVSMEDGSLVGRLKGNRANHLTIKRVEIENNEQIDVYLFFYMSGTKWDEIVTNYDVFSEYILCAADKGAAHIDRVFYYTGDYTRIENMDMDDLQEIIYISVLLWSKS